jgi:transposase-like protein
LVTELLVGLGERGLDVTRPILAVLDGSKALRRAVVDVFDHAVMQRCQLHKIKNAQDPLPQKLRSVTTVASRSEPDPKIKPGTGEWNNRPGVGCVAESGWG